MIQISSDRTCSSLAMLAASNEQNCVLEPSLNTRRIMARALSVLTHRNVTLTQLRHVSGVRKLG